MTQLTESSSGVTGQRAGWLVLGGLHMLNGAASVEATDSMVVIPLKAPLESAFPSNTIVLRWEELGPLELRACTFDGRRRQVGKSSGAQLFSRLVPGPDLQETVEALGGTRTLAPLVPLFYVSCDGSDLHLYSQIRFLAADACFIRITTHPLRSAGVESLDWLPEAVRLHAENFLFLNNHQRYYRKCFAGRELEYKYTLAPPVDSWTVNAELYQTLSDGALPGYVMEYRDEFQAWDYLNHLFEVTAPEAERGYVSFIPTTDGKKLMKRKWYAQDSFERRESHTYGLALADDGDFERHIREELAVEAVRLPSFRRVRYDVNFESVRTGHVYGIFFDHCSLVADRDVTLNQCELEYLRSRVVIEPDESAVLDELEEIAQWLEEFLRLRGLDHQRGFYSKRTFLKDVVADRPELAGRAS